MGHDRYVLGELLGAGGFGQVHRAHDRLTGDTVAVKLVPALSPADLARSRRELAALRWLHLPGVVRLRDDGIDGASWFMVMDLVEGLPFGTGPTSEGWLAPALALLETLARVHLAGVLHLDLKPANVLVDTEGRVVVLDFGVARGRSVPTPVARVEGTPRWMAPEQLRGGPCDARADLYAVGRMLTSLLPLLPSAAEPVVRAMTSPDPQGRPSSALEVWRALSGRSPFPRVLDRRRRWTRRELRAMFGGPDRFTHAASDAATLLWHRTGGDPDRVGDLVQQWVLGGRVTWDDEHLLVDRPGAERLGGTDPDLVGGKPADVIATATTQRRRGRLDAAAALLDAALPLVQEAADELPAVLVERVLAALAAERLDAAELALYALDRAGPVRGSDELGSLVRLARAVLRGEAAAAAALARDVPVFTHPELEVWRQGYRVQAARLRGPEDEAAMLRELEAWATDRYRRAKLGGWRGNQLYRRGRFREAALAHVAAAASKEGVDRLVSTTSAASAWLEALDLEEADACARRAVRQAVRLRHATAEAFATWLVRTVAYRRGVPRPVDLALVDEAAALKPYLGALFATTDAATAFRAGDDDLCATLAGRAADAFAATGMPSAGLLARALAAWAAGPDRDALAALAEEASGCPVPDLELQVLAFARWAHPRPPDAWIERARAAAATRPAEQHGVRLDVLSVAEALADHPPR